MHIPTNFKQTDINEIKHFLKNNAFASIITNKNNEMLATHNLVELNENNDTIILETHISLANEQKYALQNGDDVMLIFLGPHTYVSASWYNHQNVSTWNYIAVHIYGKVRLMDEQQKYHHLNTLLNKYESSQKCPVSFKTLDDKVVNNNLKGVHAFFIDIKTIQAAYKLSQNRNDEDFKNITQQLLSQPDTPSQEVAKEMQKLRQF